ncbi:MAG TPA: hypothetical protein VFQ58_06030 [Flavisolibacter sp.]|nr:hypothetical protein [Flavisolibacter sp.]
MKNKLIAFTLLIITVVTISSCYSTRNQYGCPSTSGHFKGR